MPSMIQPIRTYPDEVLRKVAKKVPEVDEDVRRICADMIETMCSARGAGLAANQIGLPLRIITVDAGTEKKSEPIAIVNPEIVKTDGEDVDDEGCLSIPGFFETVKRAKRVIVTGFSPEGKELKVECEGLLARACQHEVDHLNGILFIDHLSPVKKQLFKREYVKEKK
jgi:peptide deformylase